MDSVESVSQYVGRFWNVSEYQNYKKLRIAVSKELSLSGFQIGKELGAHRIKAAQKYTGSQ